MAILLRMPEVAAGATHAALQAWTRSEGEHVGTGDCLAEIESDKAVVELNAQVPGMLARILVQPGVAVPVGAPIAVLLSEGEGRSDLERLLADAGLPAVGSDTGGVVDSPEVSSQRVFASPLARVIAQERGLSLAQVKGSGPNGRIVKRDVERGLGPDDTCNGDVSGPVSGPVAPTPSTPAPPNYSEIPHGNMRRVIARRLAESKATIPHFYLTVECRMDRLLSLRAEVNADTSLTVSVNDFVVRAAALALREVPAVNVSWTESALRQYSRVDVAIAVSTASGLITPVMRAADTKSLSAISAEVDELARRARASRLRPEEFQGGSFSVSNLGMYGVTEFSAIINPPQAAILSVGAAQPTPVVDSHGSITAASVMRCVLSVDHRAIDGALAAQWLGAFKRLIEHPLTLLI